MPIPASNPTLTLRCAFPGCGRLIELDPESWVRHAEPPPSGIAIHTVHYDLPSGIRVIDMTEMDEREQGGES